MITSPQLAFTLPDRLVRLHKVSSVDFATQAFELYSLGVPFVIDNPGGPSDQLQADINDVTPAHGGGWLKLPPLERDDAAPAQIIFSSGTQGAAKAIVVSYGALANVVQRLNKAMAVDSSIREYVGVPVTYSFGLGRLRAVAAAEGQAYLPAQGFDINEIIAMLNGDAINAISAVPTLWRLVLERADKFAGLGEKVRWIEIGSQYMSGEEKAQLRALFPNAQIVQHYGLTEASRSTLLDVTHSPREALDSVGRIAEGGSDDSESGDGVEVKLAEDGRIMVRGPHVALGVLLDGQLESLTDDQGWLLTSDLGRIDQGRLYYLGRADDIINCSGVKIDPDALQQRMTAASQGLVPEQVQFAVCAVPHELRGQGVFVATTDGEHSAQLRRLAQQCLQVFGLQANDAVAVGVVDSIPTTATGKVQRKALAQLYQPQAHSAGGGAKGVMGMFEEYFGPQVQPQDTFKTLGGDSLRYVQVGSKLEDLIGPPPAGWEGMPLQQLASLQTQTPVKVARVEITVFLRAVAILAVVVIHAGIESLFGATVLLFMLVGYNFARFQTDALIEGARPRWQKIGRFIGVALIPYYGFAVLLAAAEKQLNVPLWLLYENFVGNQLTLIFPFWFVQQLVQCLLLLGLLFSIPVSRSWLRQNIQLCSLLVCALVVASTLAFQWLVQPVGAQRGWPIASYLALFFVGWSFFHAPNLVSRVLVSVMGISVAATAFGWHSKTAWLVLGCTGLCCFTSVYTGAWLRRLFEAIAASTLYLFVTNGIVIYVGQKIIGPQPLPLALMALLVGMGSWYLYERSRLKQRFVI